MKWETPVGVIALVLLVVGSIAGLFWAPPEEHMQEVSRILYVHVPAAWTALATFAVAFVGALGFLVTGRRSFDWLVESACEVGVVMTALLIVLGSIFARPTWDTWWSWDPRLTTTAVMLLSFVAILILRSVVADPDRRAVWSAAATLLSFVNVPIVYWSVDWWVSLHQDRNTSMSIDEPIQRVLDLNTVAFVVVTVWFLTKRWRIAKLHGMSELPEPLPPPVAS